MKQLIKKMNVQTTTVELVNFYKDLCDNHPSKAIKLFPLLKTYIIEQKISAYRPILHLLKTHRKERISCLSVKLELLGDTATKVARTICSSIGGYYTRQDIFDPVLIEKSIEIYGKSATELFLSETFRITTEIRDYFIDKGIKHYLIDKEPYK